MTTGSGTHSRDWSWRVSVADIMQDDPFSMFPGMDRHLTLIQGRGIVLRGAGGSMRLAQIGDFASGTNSPRLQPMSPQGAVARTEVRRAQVTRL